MSLEEALLLASLARDDKNPYVQALKVVGYHFSIAAKKLIQQEKTIRKLEWRKRK